jgi:hypothetical protein
MKTKILFILFFVLQLCKLTGQVDTSRTTTNFFWVNLSPQFLSSPRINILTAFSASFNYSIQHKHFFKINYYKTQNDDIDTLYTDKFSPNRLTSLQTFSIQYGKGNFITNEIIVAIYCGLSYNIGIYRKDVSRSIYNPGGLGFLNYSPPSTGYYYNYDFFKNIGVPITFNFMFPFLPVMGIGLDIYANISKYSSFGVAVNFSFGHIVNREIHYLNNSKH